MRALAVFAALVLCACGAPQANYPPHYEMNFMQACEARQSRPGLCACVWERIEAEVPRAEFDALEALPVTAREAHPLTARIEGFALACNAEREGTR